MPEKQTGPVAFSQEEEILSSACAEYIKAQLASAVPKKDLDGNYWEIDLSDIRRECNENQEISARVINHTLYLLRIEGRNGIKLRAPGNEQWIEIR